MDNNLVKFRKAAGLTQQALADKSGVNIRQIQMYESGQTLIANMTAKNAVAIAKALGITVEELIK